MEETERVRAILASGDTGRAVTAAIEAVGPSVLGYLCALHPEDDAWDVFSLWEHDVWRGLPGFRFECPLRVWAFRLAWRASARFRRDPWQARRERLQTSAASRLPASASRAASARGHDERILKLRERLEPEDLTLLVLRLDREMTWDEVAAVLSEGGPPVAVPTLRKRYERLKGRLGRMARRRSFARWWAGEALPKR